MLIEKKHVKNLKIAVERRKEGSIAADLFGDFSVAGLNRSHAVTQFFLVFSFLVRVLRRSLYIPLLEADVPSLVTFGGKEP